MIMQSKCNLCSIQLCKQSPLIFRAGWTIGRVGLSSTCWTTSTKRFCWSKKCWSYMLHELSAAAIVYGRKYSCWNSCFRRCCYGSQWGLQWRGKDGNWGDSISLFYTINLKSIINIYISLRVLLFNKSTMSVINGNCLLFCCLAQLWHCLLTKRFQIQSCICRWNFLLWRIISRYMWTGCSCPCTVVCLAEASALCWPQGRPQLCILLNMIQSNFLPYRVL